MIAVKPTKFRLWYIHQVPGEPFEQEITNPADGQRILDTISNLMMYLYATKHIPDYANMGGIAYLDEDGDWIDYHPEEWEDES